MKKNYLNSQNVVRGSFIFLMLNFFNPDNTQAQPETVRFKNITSDEGLSHNSVNCIFQDYKGFVWVGTDEGLNKYDGYNFKVYKYQSFSPNSLSSNKIYKIFEDSAKNLWIGTADGLNLYQRTSDSFLVYKRNPADTNSLCDNRVRDIFEDSRKRLWIGTQGGLEHFDPVSGSFRHFKHDPADLTTISNNVVFSIAEDRQGYLWIGTHLGINRFEEAENRFVRYQFDPPVKDGTVDYSTFIIHVDYQGIVWFGTMSGMYRYRAAQDDVEGIPLVNSAGTIFPQNPILAMADDSSKNLWLGTTDGLYRFNRPDKQVEFFFHQTENPQSISDNDVSALFVDRTGLLWIGTLQGINQFDSRTSYYYYYRHIGTRRYKQSSDRVTDIVLDTEGELWIGTAQGLWRKKKHADDFILYTRGTTNSFSLSSDDIYTLYRDRNENLWIGTSFGLNKYISPADRFQQYIFDVKDIASRRLNFIYCILQDRHGMYWLGTFGGLIKFNPQGRLYRIYRQVNTDSTSLSNNVVTTIFEDREGELWIGTQDGLNLFEQADDKFHTYRNVSTDSQSISANSITVITQDTSGRLWIGTSGGGLNRFDKKTGNFTCFNEKSGLPNSVIHDIVADEDDYFWVSTTKGLVRFNPYELKPLFRVYDRTNGLPADEFTLNSAIRAKTGVLYFGTKRGFFHFQPRQIKQRGVTPPVVLTQFKLFNHPVTLGPAPITESQQIVLSYRDNVFTFEFAALDYAVPQKNILAYKMDGFDKKWTETEGNKNSATYTNLNPGIYTFRVKGSTGDGVWNEAGTAIKVVIKPPFWSKWWFRFILLLFLAGAVFLVFKLRTNSISKHNRELQRINSQLNKEIQERQHVEREIQHLNLELEQRILDRTQRLEEINKELEIFTISVTHDLRAPLRSIESFSHILREECAEKLDETGKDYLMRICNSAHQLSGMINELLKLSRAARSEICKEEVNLSHMVYSILNDFKIAHPERQVEARIEQDVMAYCDPQMIRVVLQNLIDNAWKFSRTQQQAVIEFGRMEGTSSTTMRAMQKSVYYVRDNGVGFDMRYSDKLFSPFQKLHKVSEYEGAGIGLATVKRIINRHDGQVWGECILGRGTTFYFQI